MPLIVLHPVDNGSMSTNPGLHLDYPDSRIWHGFVLGRAGMDLYPQPDGGKIKNAQNFSADMGGSGGNIAAAMVKAGAKVGLISGLSDDAVGHFVRQQLKQYHIDDHLVQTTDANERTSLAIAEVRPEDCEVVIYRNDAADLQVKASADIKSALGESYNLIVTGTSLVSAESSQNTMEIMEDANKMDCRVWLDLDYRPWNWPDIETTRKVYTAASKLAQVLVGNEEEFAVLHDDIDQQIQQCRSQNQLMLLKRGSQGATLYCGSEQLDTGIYALDPLKPYGAGDAFLGNLVYHYTQSQNWQTAIEAGSAAAALVVSQRGCASVMPHPEQISGLQKSKPLTPAAQWS